MTAASRVMDAAPLLCVAAAVLLWPVFLLFSPLLIAVLAILTVLTIVAPKRLPAWLVESELLVASATSLTSSMRLARERFFDPAPNLPKQAGQKTRLTQTKVQNKPTKQSKLPANLV